jgi:hypothetical protein
VGAGVDKSIEDRDGEEAIGSRAIGSKVAGGARDPSDGEKAREDGKEAGGVIVEKEAGAGEE